MTTYTIENNKFYKQVGNKKVEFRSLGATLYPGHAYSPGVIERAITNGIKHGHHTMFRSVLMFEGFRGDNPLNAPGWKTVKMMLQLGKKYKVGITVEIGSALLSWLERQGLNPYDEKYDAMFEDVIKKACRMYGRFANSSLFAFTCINEFGPYRKNEAFFQSVFRRLQMTAALIKDHGKNEILVGSGGLLHLSKKSGGIPKPFPTCPWINNGETNQVYWEGVYTCPKVDFNMIHIYAKDTQTIDNNNSEWTNLEFYHDFSAQHGKPFIVDEFGMKLERTDEEDLDASVVTCEGLRFLEAISKQLQKVPKEKLPPILEFWNFNSSSVAFDWWPEFSYHKPLFLEGFQNLQKDYFPCENNGGVKLTPRTFQLHKTQKGLALQETGHKVTYDFAAGKLSKQLCYTTTFPAPIGFDEESDGICCTIASKIKEDQFDLKIRFHLLLLEKDKEFPKEKRVKQGWNSVKQNDIIPTMSKNEMFVDFRWGDLGDYENIRKNYVMKSLALELISAKPKYQVKGGFTLKNVRFACK